MIGIAERIVVLHRDGLNDVRISERLGISASAVRWHRRRLSLPAVRLGISEEQRFWRYVLPEPNSGCWLWDGAQDAKGYGRIGRRGRGSGQAFATHLALKIDGRPVPPGYCACHRCDNPSCVNPAHLFIGTNAENLADMRAKGRAAVGERHPSAKLSARAVAEIRAELLSGGRGTQRAVARRLGLSEQQVSKIAHGKAWRDENATA